MPWLGFAKARLSWTWSFVFNDMIWKPNCKQTMFGVFFFFLLWSWICYGDPVWWYSVYSEIILKKEITNEVNIKGISYDWAWISTWWHQKRLLMRLKYTDDCNQIIVMLLRGQCPCINEKLFKVTVVKYTRWQKRRFLAYDCDACDLQIRFEYCGK